MPYSVKGFFEINEDMVQILLMLEVLFTQNSKVEDLFCGASSGSEPSLFFSNYFFSLGFQPIQDDFQLGRQPVRRYSDQQNLRPDSQHSLLPDFPIVLVSNRPYRATYARLTNV